MRAIPPQKILARVPNFWYSEHPRREKWVGRVGPLVVVGVGKQVTLSVPVQRHLNLLKRNTRRRISIVLVAIVARMDILIKLDTINVAVSDVRRIGKLMRRMCLPIVSLFLNGVRIIILASGLFFHLMFLSGLGTENLKMQKQIFIS